MRVVNEFEERNIIRGQPTAAAQACQAPVVNLKRLANGTRGARRCARSIRHIRQKQIILYAVGSILFSLLIVFVCTTNEN